MWRNTFRQGAAPLLSDQSLRALLAACEADDPRLIQGQTTFPAPVIYAGDCRVAAACALGYCGWMGDGLETVGEAEEFFARMCFEIDQRLGEPAACRWFLNWYDETPRDVMRQELASEIRRELMRRENLPREQTL